MDIHESRKHWPQRLQPFFCVGQLGCQNGAKRREVVGDESVIPFNAEWRTGLVSESFVCKCCGGKPKRQLIFMMLRWFVQGPVRFLQDFMLSTWDALSREVQERCRKRSLSGSEGTVWMYVYLCKDILQGSCTHSESRRTQHVNVATNCCERCAQQVVQAAPVHSE